MRGFFCVSVTLICAACIAETQSVKLMPDSCGAAAMQDFVGQPESVLMATTFAVPVRFIHPTDAVTMDFSPDRLNFDIDSNGIITRVRCG